MGALSVGGQPDPNKTSQWVEKAVGREKDMEVVPIVVPSEANVFREGVPSACVKLESLDLHPGYKLYDVNFYDGDMMKASVRNYYDLIVDHTTCLSVTTSCFTPWRKAKKTNGAGKIVPAAPSSFKAVDGEVTRIFFFDDNINLHLGGAVDAEGLCNLRDINTGEFVDFSVGKNGYKEQRFFRHTTVQSSAEYNTVLIQANILDAMINKDYFQKIISTYATPEERVVCIMDVNGTIMPVDTAAAKDMSITVIMCMARLLEVRPRPGQLATLEWPGKAAVSMEAKEDLRGLVNRLSAGDNEFYRSFWSLATIEQFLDKVAGVADLAWEKHCNLVEPRDFMKELKKNIQLLESSPLTEGITPSFYNCYAAMVEGGHSTVLNSYGTDSSKVLDQIAPNKKDVLQLTVNYKMWGEKDLTMWNKQFMTGDAPERRP